MVSATAVVKAITSCFTSFSISWMRATSKPACARSRRGGLGGHHAQLGQRFGGRQFHFQPLLKFVLVAPDPAHLGPRVSGNHDVIFRIEKLRVGRSAASANRQPRRQAALLQRLGGHHLHDLGMVVVLAQVAQHQVARCRNPDRASGSPTSPGSRDGPRGSSRAASRDHGYGPTFSMSRS